MRTVEVERHVSLVYRADVEAMRRDFAQELAEDEAETDEQVVRACWNNDVGEPYFELLREDENEDLTIKGTDEPVRARRNAALRRRVCPRQRRRNPWTSTA
jgi:hypothetical protein